MQHGQTAYIPDNVYEEESNNGVTTVSPQNVEETTSTSPSDLSTGDTAATSEETDAGTSTSESDPSVVDEASSRRYPSQSHQPPTRFDNYIRL